VEKIKLLVEFIGVVLGIFLVIIAPIPFEWKVIVGTIIICGGAVIILGNRIHKKLVFRWPIIRRKKTTSSGYGRFGTSQM
jgi:hypothetical protein